MTGPSRAMSVQVLLTVGPDHLVLDPPEAEPLEIRFDPTVFVVDRGSGETGPGSLETHGQALWRAAMSGPLSSALDRAASRAHIRGVSLTLRVLTAPNLDAPLRWLPWELLFDPGRRDFLALKSGWSLVRGIDPTRRNREIMTPRPRVLAVDVITSYNGGLGTVNEEIGSIADVADVEVVRVPSEAQPSMVQDILANADAEIVHVIGHCSDRGLWMPSSTEVVTSGEIGRAIARNERVAMLVLNASSGAEVAEEVTRVADVAVLGHRQPVPEQHAVGLAHSFYQNFFAGFPADVALTEARRYLDRQFPGDRAWASAFLLTGWPPPAVPVPARPTAPQTDEEAADPGASDTVTAGIDAADLTRKLHSMNQARVAQLLEVADWERLTEQLDDAERGLDR
jgi:hypothetical protein